MCAGIPDDDPPLEPSMLMPLEAPPHGGTRHRPLLAPPSSPEPLLAPDDPLPEPKLLLLLLPQLARAPTVALNATNPKTAHFPGLSLLNRIIEFLVGLRRGIHARARGG
jgi:hypothetical protein